ncbi:HupE/UreJ family protein [Diaphorobacter caeni]|uniref:HupE/UreJ family protein n=1 Tax=Diaphorobacter caeni TaxID=2784387 RepID=UPI001890A7E4|nr:HupE/UreJ family protein [Diaphorobacter caeni]MBF5005645.1 HupE/UreJ family protein [Diaphorobacter caeni]
MSFNKSNARRAAFILLALVAGAAQAHPGHGEEGFASGLVHPFLGLDHLLAMVAVGTWSCIAMPGAKRVVGPLVFLAFLAAGALLAPVVSISMTSVEIGVALSVALFGALMLLGRNLNSLAGLAIVGAAAFLHGIAHGNDLLTGEPAMAMIGGMLLGSALLHGAGYAVGTQLLNAPRWVNRAMAAGLGMSGLAMLVTRF